MKADTKTTTPLYPDGAVSWTRTLRDNHPIYEHINQVECEECGQYEWDVGRWITDGSAFEFVCSHRCECDECGQERDCDGRAYLDCDGNEIDYQEWKEKAHVWIDFLDRQMELPLIRVVQ